MVKISREERHKNGKENVKPQGYKPKMRYATEGETYAKVIKMNGQGNVDVL